MVAEVVMQPEETPLLKAAKVAGARVHPGRFMLDAQLDLIGRHIGAS